MQYILAITDLYWLRLATRMAKTAVTFLNKISHENHENAK